MPDPVAVPHAPVRPLRASRQEHLRAQNLAVVLTHVVDAVVPPSRAQVAAATGLSRGAVTALTDVLVDAGLVRELEPAAAVRAGRPAVPLAPVAGRVAGVGLEVNVDYLGVRVVDLAGGTLGEVVEHVDLRGSMAGQVLSRLVGLAAPVLAEVAAQGVHLAGAALALPGLVDRVTGPLRVAPNLGWRDVDVLALLAATPLHGGLVPRLGNEAKLAARAEARARRADGPPSFLYVSGEVGIGGAVVLDGDLYAGRHGWSAEIGHVVVDGRASGRAGTLEALAGQDAIAAAAGLVGRPFGEVVAAVVAGEPRAVAAAAGAGRWLGLAVASVANVVDVGQVVLGGTFAHLAEHVRGPVQQALDEHVIFAPWSPPEVSAAVAGDYPATTGGALAVLRQVVADPLALMRTVGGPPAGG